MDFTHVYEANGNTFSAILDHFFWSQNLDDEIVDAGVIHHVDNKSDHSPIYCVLKLKDGIPDNNSNSETTLRKLKPSWNKSTQEQKENFKINITSLLEPISIPECISGCSNPKCKNLDHEQKTDNFLMETLEAVDKAAESCIVDKNIPSGGKNVHSGKNKKIMPGWNAQVKPFRENAAFWFSIWKSAGKPMNTQLHTIMKRTRNLYHYQVRKCQKSEDLIKKNNFLNSCLNGSADIFSEIKKLRKSKNDVANRIDDKTNHIEEHFAGIYKNLYNSVDDKDDLEQLYKEVENKINNKSVIDVEKVTPNIVKEAVSHLNNNKTDPVFSFTSDFLKNSPDILFKYLSIISALARTTAPLQYQVSF